ncbi:hypothetical protein HCA06_14600 [Listeria welshimeri]|nr:hypothetical protein [Listeria welshimeri]
MNINVDQINGLNKDQKKELLSRLQKIKHSMEVQKATLPELFDSISKQYHNRIAVSSNNSHMSYQTLANLTKSIAAFLQTQGVLRGWNGNTFLNKIYKVLRS